MTTLKITVEGKRNALLLKKMLRSMNFIKNIEEEKTVKKSQFLILKEIFKDVKPNTIFTEINDPVKWQNQLRDEWETC